MQNKKYASPSYISLTSTALAQKMPCGTHSSQTDPFKNTALRKALAEEQKSADYTLHTPWGRKLYQGKFSDVIAAFLAVEDAPIYLLIHLPVRHGDYCALSIKGSEDITDILDIMRHFVKEYGEHTFFELTTERETWHTRVPHEIILRS